MEQARFSSTFHSSRRPIPAQYYEPQQNSYSTAGCDLYDALCRSVSGKSDSCPDGVQISMSTGFTGGL
ncbi:hypothetical protein BJ508DRAFT_410908 [Ascobolus immersus RN42]|uniref:Uncharacterized protein n=1 Tax=Ascobolus immersus RN42 TaxID=1160509 RepID=A0A3N4IKP0_ASCIM|nr:hypothetical protein BJ508DRAFT_410908 [Ascobolus immersus RN42]